MTISPELLSVQASLTPHFNQKHHITIVIFHLYIHTMTGSTRNLAFSFGQIECTIISTILVWGMTAAHGTSAQLVPRPWDHLK